MRGVEWETEGDGREWCSEACIKQVCIPPLFTHHLTLMTPHHFAQGTTNQHQHPPHIHEQLLMGCIVGAFSDDGDDGDDKCNLAPSCKGTLYDMPPNSTICLQSLQYTFCYNFSLSFHLYHYTS